MHTLGKILELVEIVAHLLLALELRRHHSRLEFLLLREGATLTGFSGLFEELEAIGHRFFIHADSLLENVQRPRDDVKLADHFLQRECQLLT